MVNWIINLVVKPKASHGNLCLEPSKKRLKFPIQNIEFPLYFPNNSTSSDSINTLTKQIPSESLLPQCDNLGEKKKKRKKTPRALENE